MTEDPECGGSPPLGSGQRTVLTLVALTALTKREPGLQHCIGIPEKLTALDSEREAYSIGIPECLIGMSKSALIGVLKQDLSTSR